MSAPMAIDGANYRDRKVPFSVADDSPRLPSSAVALVPFGLVWLLAVDRVTSCGPSGDELS